METMVTQETKTETSNLLAWITLSTWPPRETGEAFFMHPNFYSWLDRMSQRDLLEARTTSATPLTQDLCVNPVPAAISFLGMVAHHLTRSSFQALSETRDTAHDYYPKDRRAKDTSGTSGDSSLG